MKRAAFLVALVALGVLACGDEIDTPRPPPSPAARDAGVRAPADAAEPLIGVITASEIVNISSRVAGVVKTINVDVGDTVEANQVLAEMDPAQLRDELRAAEAALAAARAALNAASVDVEDARRKVTLETKAVAGGISAQQALDEARLNLRRAEATRVKVGSTAAAEAARVQTARDHVTDAGLRTPFGGKVDFKYVTAGGRVEAGGPILRIVGDAKRRLKFAVPSGKKVSLGTQVTADVGNGDQRVAVTATVKYVTPTIDPASGLVFIEAELGSGNADLQPGLPAWVHPF